MSLGEFLLCVLSAAQIIEIWHHGSLFALPRAYLEARGGWISRLLGCPFCLSPWAGLLVASVWVGSADLIWYFNPRLLLLAFAIARATNLLNDATHGWSRLHSDRLPPPVPAETPVMDETNACASADRRNDPIGPESTATIVEAPDGRTNQDV